MKPITDKMVENLVKESFIPIENKISKIKEITNQQDNFLELIYKATQFEIEASKELPFIDKKELRNILYSFIFEQNSSLKEMTQEEMILGIINESLYSTHEHLMSDEIFVASITRWLKYHVIPYIYEHKEEYEAEDKETLLEYSSEIAEERNHGGTIEHRHLSNMYWHPVTRVHHPDVTKDKLPQGHVLNKETEKSTKTWGKLVDKTVKTFKEQNPYNEKYQLIENLIIKELQKSIVSDLFRPMDLNQILYVLISEKNLSLINIIHNPVHIKTIIDSSLIDLEHISKSYEKECITWLRKILIPKIFDELGIKETTNIYSDNLEFIKETTNIYAANLDNSNNLQYIDFEKLINYLFHNYYKINFLIELDYEINSDTNLIYNEITSLYDLSNEQEKDIKLWLRNWIIPSINNIIYEKIKKEKSPETIISEGFSGIPSILETITKSEISSCIFPLNLNYISKEKFDKLPKLPKNIVDILYTYFNNEENINEDEILGYSDEIYDKLFTNLQQKFSKEYKKNIFQWLKHAVIPCIIKIINKDKQKDEYVPEIKQIDFTIKEESPLYKRMNIIVRNFYDSFYTHDSLCLYYTYYILKLKGNTDFDLEFRELEDKLYRDFYNYGIFAIIGELRHFIGVFHYTYKYPNHKEIEIGDYIPYRSGKEQHKFKPGFKEVVTDIAKCVKIDVKDIYKIINIDEINKHTSYRYNNRDIDDKENLIIRDTEFLYLIEKYFGYYTRPEFILKVAVKAFSITKENLSTCRWSESYGGEAWGTIARTILHRKDTTSKTIFVDTCWSLQHNTALFINKVYSQDGNRSDNSLSLVKYYLTEIKDGLFKNVYNCAIKYNTKLDRFIYKTLILENDASVPDAKYKIEQGLNKGLTERQVVRLLSDKRNPVRFDDYPKSSQERRISKQQEILYNIIFQNKENLDNQELKSIIDNYIGFNLLADKLQILIYKENYTPQNIIDNVNTIVSDLLYYIKYSPAKYKDTSYEDIYRLTKLWITDYLIPDLEESIFSLKKQPSQYSYPEKQAENEALIIQEIIANNIKNLANQDMKELINSTIIYNEMSTILQKWIYQSKYSTLDIEDNSDLLIKHSLQHFIDDEPETLELLQLWIKDYLIPELIKETPLKKMTGLGALFG